MIIRSGWREEAACLDVDPELFYPLGDERGPEISPAMRRDLDEAKAFCHGIGRAGGPCPVMVECLEDALDVEGFQTYGVRGGTDPHERQAILRRRGWARTAAQRAAEAREADAVAAWEKIRAVAAYKAEQVSA